jgi:hypothetical protein
VPLTLLIEECASKSKHKVTAIMSKTLWAVLAILAASVTTSSAEDLSPEAI